MSHLTVVDETYCQHLKKAIGFGFRLTFSGIACILHGIFPELFKTTASSTVMSMHSELAKRNHLSTNS